MNLKKIVWAILIFAAWCVVFSFFIPEVEFVVFFSVLASIVSASIVVCIKELHRRWQLGIPLLEKLDQTKEQVQNHLLFRFQYGHYKGIKGLIEELNYTFRCYPEYELTDWIVFRSWYKDLVDHALAHPDIYTLTVNGGEPYRPEDDNLYDPNAPAWSEYALKREYDDDDDDESEDDLLDWDPFAKEKEESKRWSDAISIGYGFALGNTLFGGSSGDGGCSSGDSGCDCGG